MREAARRLVPGAVAAPTWRRYKERFFAALADDFNTPTALAAVFGLDPRGQPPRARHRRRRPARDARQILALDNLLDGAGPTASPMPPPSRCSSSREAARATRDFAEADRLRDELAAQGWQVRDSADGPQLVRVDP